ncbi:zona occludens toxin (predicted ATPase) [Salinibacterium sp. CAN_S4]|uniref:hypothetical protein n=1 Tax=Salinibacterium sp. CAN_S4 TaxID=2787727 RepID=UPI0018EFDD2A
MAELTQFVDTWAASILTLVLISVTIWYAVQTQKMARAARESADSSREAAQYSARSAAIAAAGTAVDFALSPTFAFDLEVEGMPFKGVRVECEGAAVYLHGIVLEEARALNPDTKNSATSFEDSQLFGGERTPSLNGLGDTPTLMHKEEFVFLEFPREDWQECEVASLAIAIDYSFDGQPPLRSRRVEFDFYHREIG